MTEQQLLDLPEFTDRLPQAPFWAGVPSGPSWAHPKLDAAREVVSRAKGQAIDGIAVRDHFRSWDAIQCDNGAMLVTGLA